VRVKICGLRSRAEVAVAAEAGAAYVGMVFFPASPRHVSLADARWVAQGVPDGIVRVALVVEPEDSALEALLSAVPIDMLQLHGRESPERVAEIRGRFGRPVMKAVGISTEEDLRQIDVYAAVADQILVDARPPRGADRPGGHGTAFEWRLLAGRRWRGPWMLAGGLTPANVAEAVRLTGAEQVDVSTSVESRPGFKDPARVREFVAAARAAPEKALAEAVPASDAGAARRP
jgi:phosphoribosylanthranilate isomerase